MSRYSAVLAGGAVVGQLVGGLLISANLFNSGWRPVFLVNVPIGVLLLAVGVRGLPHGKGEPGRTLDLPGLALLTPAVLAFVLPLVLGQPERWPAWGWVLMAASVPLVAAFAVAERRVAGSGGTPLIPGRVLRVPGIPVAIAALFTVMTIFSGFFFTLALHLQDGLGYSPLRAGLTFAPAAATFALVSLNWRRLPARWHSALIIAGFVAFAAAMAGLAALLRDGGTGGVGIYLIGGLSGAGMAAAFSPLMTRVLLRVPVELAADATGVVVTVNQLGLLVGVATFGTLYLNLAGRLPGPATLGAFRHISAHAEAVTFLALAAWVPWASSWPSSTSSSATEPPPSPGARVHSGLRKGARMAIVVLVLWLFTAGAGFSLLVTSNLSRARLTPPAQPKNPPPPQSPPLPPSPSPSGRAARRGTGSLRPRWSRRGTRQCCRGCGRYWSSPTRRARSSASGSGWATPLSTTARWAGSRSGW